MRGTDVAMMTSLLLLTLDAAMSATTQLRMPSKSCGSHMTDLDAAIIRAVEEKTSHEHCRLVLTTRDKRKWMMSVERMSIMNCDVTLTVFRGDVSAEDNNSQLAWFGCACRLPGVVQVNDSTVTLFLDNSNRTEYTFSVTFTAAIPHEEKCPGFQCEENGLCVSRSLLCDGVDNCFDFTDESKNSSAYCTDYRAFSNENVGVLVSVVVVAAVIMLTSYCCRWCRAFRRRMQEDDLFDMAHTARPRAYVYAMLRPGQRPQPKPDHKHKKRKKREPEGYSADNSEMQF